MPTKADEDLCEAAYVMEEMTDRLYEAENNLELNINRIIEERDKVFDFEKDSIVYFKEHGCLPEWYIRYKLGQRLKLGYNLIRKEDGQYKEDPNYSVGYGGGLLRRVLDEHGRYYESPLLPAYGKYEDYALTGAKLDHWRFNYDGERDPEGCEAYLLDLFKNYFFDKKVCIYSHEGCVHYKVVDKSYMLKDNEDPWDDDDWIECSCMGGTVDIVMDILSTVHKSVFVND